MIKGLILSAVLFAVIAFSLSAYLAPDDLRTCSAVSLTNSECAASDAIVAVSGGDTTARTNEAINLYKAGWGKKLIFSGAAADKSGPSNAKAMQGLAEQAGVSDSDIIIEEYGETTKENAEKTRNIFNEYNIKSVILVTSGYHQRRAGLEFSQRSPDVTIRNHPVASDAQWSSWWWLTPTGWYLALSEFFKIIAFYVGGSR
ncbi:MAG: YdcF family protein [Candidatus Saccharimonadales bacterium]